MPTERQLYIYIIGAGQFASGDFGIDEERQLNLLGYLSIVKGSCPGEPGQHVGRIGRFAFS